ncbi:MAG: helix-turn-helix domain-containing protein [Bacteroidia bacterium]
MSKEALSFEEAWKFLRISASQLYKISHKRIIPAFKPGGKLLYFKRKDLENWMLSNRKKTDKEQTAEALNKLKK